MNSWSFTKCLMLFLFSFFQWCQSRLLSFCRSLLPPIGNSRVGIPDMQNRHAWHPCRDYNDPMSVPWWGNGKTYPVQYLIQSPVLYSQSHNSTSIHWFVRVSLYLQYLPKEPPFPRCPWFLPFYSSYLLKMQSAVSTASDSECMAAIWLIDIKPGITCGCYCTVIEKNCANLLFFIAMPKYIGNIFSHFVFLWFLTQSSACILIESSSLPLSPQSKYQTCWCTSV